MKNLNRDDFFNLYSEILMDENTDDKIQQYNIKKNKSIEDDFLIIKKSKKHKKKKSMWKKIINFFKGY